MLHMDSEQFGKDHGLFFIDDDSFEIYHADQHPADRTGAEIHSGKPASFEFSLLEQIF